MAILVDLVVFLASEVFLRLLLSLPLFGAFKKWTEHFSFWYGLWQQLVLWAGGGGLNLNLVVFLHPTKVNARIASFIRSQPLPSTNPFQFNKSSIHFTLQSSVTQPTQKNTSIFWDIIWCSALKSQPMFQRNKLPPSSGSKNKPSKPLPCHLLSRWYLAQLTLRPWRWRRYVPPKRRLTFNGIHCATS
jgi:hypothetical protein